MTALSTYLDRQLARTVAITGRAKERSKRRKNGFNAATHTVDFCARGVFYLWRNRRYLTLLKLANMALVNVQFVAKTERVIGRPYNMKIESTNICNTKCQLCPTGIGLEGRKKGKMDTEKFYALIRKLRWHVFGLDLSMWGDPLIVPDIYKMIRYAHDQGIWTYISSNLHAYKLGKGQAEQIVNSGLDMLTCSLHGASQETFAIYQPGKNFGDAVAKVREIVATRDRMGSSTPVIQLNFVVTRHNEHEKQAFTALAKELGCRAVFSTASMNTRFLGQDKQLQSLGLSDDLMKKKVQEHLKEWMPTNTEDVLSPYQEMAQTGKADAGDYNGKKVFRLLLAVAHGGGELRRLRLHVLRFV